jgi:CPA2 family monovalent cation:H+ antiporter-2
MAALANIEAYSDALVVLGIAGILVPSLSRLGVSPVLGYLGAGALLGPFGLGSLRGELGLFRWLTISDAKGVAGIAELGVVFLLFMIGLELSYGRLQAMRRLVFGLGSLQVIVSTAVIAALATLLGNAPAPSIIIGGCLALSSTAIVVEVLAGQERLATIAGRTSLAILLAQDLAVVPLLLFLFILSAGTGASVGTVLALAAANALLGIGLIVVAGRVFLRPLFRLVASTGASEPFMAATLFVIVATGVAASSAGLSMALGAFVAGILLAETEYRKAIEIAIEPFKGVLLGLFFFTVGMQIDFREIINQPLLVFGAIAALVFIKAILLSGLAALFGVPRGAALEIALLLGPAGEFAFVGIGLAHELGLVSATLSSFALAVTSLSMAFVPALGALGRRTSYFEKRRRYDPDLLAVPRQYHGHAIVVGHGRVGQVLCSLLERHVFPFIASDKNPDVVSKYRRSGRDVYFGDATNPAFLRSCGIERAKAVIITATGRKDIDEIIKAARFVRPDIVIVSRARDAVHASHLYEIGVTDAVPETIEASLQLSEASLVGLGLPAGPVIASIHEMRDEFRTELQNAARRSGKQITRAIRRKTPRGQASLSEGRRTSGHI